MKLFARTALCAALITAAAGLARAEPDRVFGRIMTEVVEPGYDTLAASASSHADAWTAFCGQPGSAGFAGLKSSFATLADAWAAVEFVRSGPAAEGFRADRLNFWPERKNAVERALNGLLAAADDADLAPQAMAAASAAVQGLPALERLLFGDGAVEADFPPGSFRCKAAAAIAANARAIAAELAASRIQATEAARAALATDIVTLFKVIEERKIRLVLGRTRAEAKPKLAEAWRSGRSLRDIEINLATLSAIAMIAGDGAPEVPALPDAVKTARKAAAALKGDLGAFAAGGERGAVILLLDAVFAAGQAAGTEIPAALGVTIGFSSADGD